jgi:peptide/nickel transport system permease protein
VLFLFVGMAAGAPWVAPHGAFNPNEWSLDAAFRPPVWLPGGSGEYLLGTDDQGRDVLSAIIWGARVSLTVGLVAVAVSACLGSAVGLIAGYAGGWTDAALMRLADVQLTFPAILVALMIGGIARAALSQPADESIAMYVVIFAVAIADWPRYARLVRGVARSELQKAYVDAARAMGAPATRIMFYHVLPNAMRPIVVLAAIGFGLAVIAEATLSFLGVGMPPTEPSMGTMIRIGNGFLYSGEWWIALFPSLALLILVLAVNVLGDWVRRSLHAP